MSLMHCHRFVFSAFFLLLPLAVGSCSGCGDGSSAAQTASGGRGDDSAEDAPLPTELRPDSTSVMLRYRADDGSWQTTEAVQQVPEAARAQVQVIDLSRSPGERQAERWVELADLRQTGPDGSYPVQVLPREQWERRLGLSAAASSPVGGPGAAAGASGAATAGSADPGGPQVGSSRLIMYSTRGCPVCEQARRFLRALKVPFVEKDIEREPAAARELTRKAARAGIRANGVPVFEFRGALVPGFDKDRLLALLRGV